MCSFELLAPQAFWGLATMLLLLLGASLSMPGYGFLGGVALELRDDAGNWAFFSGASKSMSHVFWT